VNASPATGVDENEALLMAADAAAIDAANAVTEADIEPRYHPVLMFYTNRQTVTFGKMLKEKGVESYSHRGKTCFDISTRSYSDGRTYPDFLTPFLSHL
jgi:hypothetical protein